MNTDKIPAGAVPPNEGHEVHRCDACGRGAMVPFADLGRIPVFCGVHWADRATAAASPAGRMVLAYCEHCAYVRNLAFDPETMVYDTTMDTNLHHSPAFQEFSARLVDRLVDRYGLAGKLVLDVGCGQGEFLRELCRHGDCSGVGYDAMYAGPHGPDPSGAVLHSRMAPRGDQLPAFDMVTSRHWIEHLSDPYDFLVDLRERAADRPVSGYLEVPDAGYDLSTAGWEVIYPHVSYFAATALHTIVERAGWQVEAAGTLFSGMFRFIEFSANRTAAPDAAQPHNTVAGPPSEVPAAASVKDAAAVGSASGQPLAVLESAPTHADRDRQLAAIAGFAERARRMQDLWRQRVADLAAAGDRPVLWGAGSRSVQFLNFADQGHNLAAVVDLNPRKWGRYLPVTAHRVDPPSALTELAPRAVILTNPAYRDEVAADLVRLGVRAEILIA